MFRQFRQGVHNTVNFNQVRRDAWVASRAKTLAPDTKILDLGAGQGPYRHLFAHCNYVTQDLALYEGTTSGLQTEKWTFDRLDYICDATAIPVPNAYFDAILCTEVLEHVPEPIAVINEIGRILRPGGRLFLTAPLGSGLHQQPYHFYAGYTPHFYHKFLLEAGIRVISIEPNGGFFRHLSQEVTRAGTLLTDRPWFSKRRLIKKLLRTVFCVIVPVWLCRIDDRIPLDEFTIGYHVEGEHV